MTTDDTGMEPEETIHRSDENDQTIEDILKDLKKLSQDDLVALYQSVSDKLLSRNGMVTDFNPVLTSVMGCNTNLLFRGVTRTKQGSAVLHRTVYMQESGADHRFV